MKRNLKLLASLRSSKIGVIFAATLGWLLTTLTATAGPLERDSALVVCPSHFRETIEPWIEYRKSQGIDLRVIESRSSAADLLKVIRDTVIESDRAIVLIGDAPVMGTPVDFTREIPIHYRKTTVSAAFRSTPTLPTDAPYGDIDDDGQMDCAVGRLPVRTRDQLKSLISRIKTYEQSQDFSAWRSQIQLIGGVGGFGVLADSTIESTTRLVLTTSLPGSVRPSVLYGSPGHLFYPPKQFTESVIDTYKKGCRVWVYAGHGSIDQLDRVPRGPTGSPVLDSRSLERIEGKQETSPIAVLLCCYTGAIDAGVESFAEKFLLLPSGPIAVIAGSRVTMPYGNASFTLGLVDAFHGKAATETRPAEKAAETLGELFLRSINQLEKEESRDRSQLQTLVDALSTLISPAGSSLVEERREHASLYGLLGDPLLQLKPPLEVTVSTQKGFDAGASIDVVVTSPIDGECTVSLDRPLGQVKKSQPGEPYVDPNDLTLASSSAAVITNQPSTFQIELPVEHRGLLRIRVHVAGESEWASGAAQTNVRPR
ncbi:MAG: C25 family cysteine peptidase [Planctomycetota bacterium]